jgi:hypothetical protein
MVGGLKKGHRGLNGEAKAPYRTFEAAKKECERIRREEGDPGVKPYHCKWCDYFHIGHSIKFTPWTGPKGRLVDQLQPELGDRAVWSLKAENVSPVNRRLGYLSKTAYYAQRNAAYRYASENGLDISGFIRNHIQSIGRRPRSRSVEAFPEVEGVSC